jgi:hypothetical protein
VLQRSHRTDQTGESGGAFGMAEDGFDGPYVERLVVVAVAVAVAVVVFVFVFVFAVAIEGAPDGFGLARIAGGRSGAVGMEELRTMFRLVDVEARPRIRLPDEGGLGQRIRHGHACRPAVLVQRRASDDALDGVSVVERSLERL